MSEGEFNNKKLTSSSGGGYRQLDDVAPEISKPKVTEDTIQQRTERQRQARRGELTFNEEDEQRWAANRERKKEPLFELGWMQVDETQSQLTIWSKLFTDQTPVDAQEFIKSCNAHLNEPVRQGEIVLIPTSEPKTAQEKSALKEMIEEAQAASEALGKLLEEEVATLNRHFEVLSYQLDERIKADGLPSEGDYYAHAAIGVGFASDLVGQHLKNIQNVLLEINDLYTSQVAMASRTGGINYGTFVSERASLFKKLDGSFARLSKRNIKLPVYTQIKRNLKLSTKSVIHNADEILKTGYVPNLGKRIANIAMGMSAAKGVGYVGILLGGASGVNNIYDACKVDGTGNCGKTITREAFGFMGGVGGGLAGSSTLATVSSAVVSGVALFFGVTLSAPVLAVVAIGGAVAGGALGGIGGGTAGKYVGDTIYEMGSEVKESIEEVF